MRLLKKHGTSLYYQLYAINIDINEGPLEKCADNMNYALLSSRSEAILADSTSKIQGVPPNAPNYDSLPVLSRAFNSRFQRNFDTA